MRMDIDQHVRELLKAMAEGVYEKEHILAMSLLSAVAGESIFLLGPPGTAKSLVARRLKMIFKDGRAFESGFFEHLINFHAESPFGEGYVYHSVSHFILLSRLTLPVFCILYLPALPFQPALSLPL